MSDDSFAPDHLEGVEYIMRKRNNDLLGGIIAQQQTRIEELEAKLAQQDDLVQAAVAAKLREAAHAIDCGCDPQRGACANMDFCPKHEVNTILALITPDAQAALDRVVAAERERGFWLGRSCGGSKAEIDAALAAIREGGE